MQMERAGCPSPVRDRFIWARANGVVTARSETGSFGYGTSSQPARLGGKLAPVGMQMERAGCDSPVRYRFISAWHEFAAHKVRRQTRAGVGSHAACYS
jgi:hypothetical protein